MRLRLRVAPFAPAPARVLPRAMAHALALALLAPIGFAAGTAHAAELSLAVEVPQLAVAEYHRPYVAIWVEKEDQSVATNLSLWSESDKKESGEKKKETTKFLAELRQWWRRSGRNQTFPIDGVSGPTRPAGTHQLRFTSAKAPLATLPPGKYKLVVEAARESGGREVLRIPFEWPAKSAQSVSVKGEHELGTVALNLTP